LFQIENHFNLENIKFPEINKSHFYNPFQIPFQFPIYLYCFKTNTTWQINITNKDQNAAMRVMAHSNGLNRSADSSGKTGGERRFTCVKK